MAAPRGRRTGRHPVTALLIYVVARDDGVEGFSPPLSAWPSQDDATAEIRRLATAFPKWDAADWQIFPLDVGVACDEWFPTGVYAGDHLSMAAGVK